LYISNVPTITTPDLSEAVRLFHALSDETRLGILEMLRDGERCVCDLQDELDVAQSRLSFHLKVLREAGIVTDRKEGRWSYYTIVPESLAMVHDLVVGMRPTGLGGRRRLPVNARCCG
jgi:ArsR family transcriptional regulator